MRRALKWCCILLPVTLLLAVGVLIPLYVIYLIAFHPETASRQQQLLYHTNHAELLGACRFILDNRSKFRPNPEWSPPNISNPDPADPLMPAIIRGMQHVSVRVTDQFVQLEFGGGGYHYGIFGYAPGVTGSGTKELTPGLWFYSEDGRIPPP